MNRTSQRGECYVYSVGGALFGADDELRVILWIDDQGWSLLHAVWGRDVDEEHSTPEGLTPDDFPNPIKPLPMDTEACAKAIQEMVDLRWPGKFDLKEWFLADKDDPRPSDIANQMDDV